MSRVIMFASGKGGVGKSSLAAALGVSFARRGLRTLLIDADMGLRNLDLMLGMQDQLLYELRDCVKRRCSLEEAQTAHPDYPNLKLMVGGQDAKPGDFDTKDLRRILKTLSRRYDLILIDGPAGIGRGIKNFFDLAERFVLVATADPVCLRDTEKLARMILDRGMERPYLLLNRYEPKYIKQGLLSRAEDIALSLDLPLLGALPNSDLVYRMMLQGKTMAESDDRALMVGIENIADRLLDIAPAAQEQAQRGLIQWLRDWMRVQVMKP